MILENHLAIHQGVLKSGFLGIKHSRIFIYSTAIHFILLFCTPSHIPLYLHQSHPESKSSSLCCLLFNVVAASRKYSETLILRILPNHHKCHQIKVVQAEQTYISGWCQWKILKLVIRIANRITSPWLLFDESPMKYVTFAKWVARICWSAPEWFE